MLCHGSLHDLLEYEMALLNPAHILLRNLLTHLLFLGLLAKALERVYSDQALLAHIRSKRERLCSILGQPLGGGPLRVIRLFFGLVFQAT